MPVRVIGSPWDDVLRGRDGFEAFYGLAGNDLIIASHGPDVIDGGEGSDTVDYSSYHGALTAWIDGSKQITIRGAGGETQTLSNIENLILGQGNDVIRGDAQDNAFWGNRGDDTFICSAGNDAYDGGAGFDTVDYSNAGIALTVKFASSTRLRFPQVASCRINSSQSRKS